MATSPNYSWPEPDNTDLVKNGALAMRTLGNAIDTTMATMVPKSIVDAKGDLIAGTAADTAARLAVGANDLLLTAASGETTGLKYTGGWTTWTPSFTNFTLGNGSYTARYQKIGKTVNLQLNITLGSTSSVSGVVIYTLPVNAGSPTGGLMTFAGYANDSSTTLNYLLAGTVYADSGYVYALASNGTYVERIALSASAPITWAVNDTFQINGTYEVA